VAPVPETQVERDLCEGSGAEDKMRVAYVSKMFAVRTDELPENRRRPPTAEEMRDRAKAARAERDRRAKEELDGIAAGLESTSLETRVEAKPVEEETDKADQGPEDSIIGFARLYSGTISKGQTVYAVLPKYNAALLPSHPSNLKHLAPVKADQLYVIMGRELVAVDQVHAGSLFGMRGLEGVVGRNATLCAFGNGQEVKADGERDQDKDCLVNLAGLVNTVSNSSMFRSEELNGLTLARYVLRRRLLCASRLSLRTRARCLSWSRDSRCSTSLTRALRPWSRKLENTLFSPPASFTSSAASRTFATGSQRSSSQSHPRSCPSARRQSRLPTWHRPRRRHMPAEPFSARFSLAW